MSKSFAEIQIRTSSYFRAFIITFYEHLNQIKLILRKSVGYY